jgi:hypothetical protein
MKGAVLVAALAAALGLASPSAAAPRLSRADRQSINATLDVFVNHAVKRQHPEAAYGVITPTLRGGMSRKQWATGSIPAYPYPAAGTRFHGWTIQYQTRDELAIELLLSPTKRYRKTLGQILFHVYLHPTNGRWLIDSFMPGATFAPIGKPGVVQAARDFTANPSAQTYNRTDPRGSARPIRIGVAYIFVPFAVLGLVLAGLAGFAVVRWAQYRRLDAGALPPSPLSIRADAGAGPRHRP